VGVTANVNGTVDSVSLTFNDTTAVVFRHPQFLDLFIQNTVEGRQLRHRDHNRRAQGHQQQSVAGDTVYSRVPSVPSGPGNRRFVGQGKGDAAQPARKRSDCQITAIAPKSRDTVILHVTFSGIKVHLESDVMDLKINDPSTITAILSDASGNPFGGDSVIFTVKGGTFSKRHGLHQPDV
jgi:hypothetical protein